MLVSIKISIIIPVYNVERHLSACVDSVINQTLNEIEIILVNDGSTDNSSEICDEYALKDNRISVIHKKNGGLSDARNTGLKKARGEFICFLDSDDWIDKNMLAEYYSAAYKDNADIVVSGIIIEYVHEGYKIDKRLRSMVCKSSQITESILECEEKGLFNPVCNKLYKSSLLKAMDIYFEKNGMPAEDLLFNCEVFKSVSTIVLIDKAYYHYMRRNEETLVTRYYDNYYEKVNDFFNARKELYEHYEILDNIGERQFNKSYLGYLHGSIKNLYRKDCPLSNKDKIKILYEIKNDITNINGSNNIFNDFFSKIINKIISGKNYTFINIKYTILFYLRNRFNWYYVKVRRNVFMKNS